MLSWATRYREIERQSAELKAGAKAVMLRRTEAALAVAIDERDGAAMRWMMTAEGNGKLDLTVGELWKAEFYRCDQAQRNAVKTRDDAQADLEAASHAFQQKVVLSERSRFDLAVAKRKFAIKHEEQRLHEAIDIFVTKPMNP